MKVFVSRGYPAEAVQALRREFDVDIHDDWMPLPKEEFKQRLSDAEILVTYFGDELDSDVLDTASSLKLIVCFYGMGRHIDMEAAARRKIQVISPPPSYGWIMTGVAELTWGLIIAVGRRFVEARKFIASGQFTHSEQGNHLLLGEGLAGRRVGILGAGRIGREVARMAAGFSVDLVYYDIAPNEEIEGYGAKFVDMDTLLKTSDYVTVHIPNTEENAHLIGKAEFQKMKKTAYIINTARGRIVDEKAMIHALQTREIAGAGLEVFENEPFVPQELVEMDNVMLVPHVGGSLRKERIEQFKRVVDICVSFRNTVESMRHSPT